MVIFVIHEWVGMHSVGMHATMAALSPPHYVSCLAEILFIHFSVLHPSCSCAKSSFFHEVLKRDDTRTNTVGRNTVL